jgi:hypothetical protein
MMHPMFIVSIGVLVVAGCAKPPGAIAPAYVSTVPYESWDCSQLTAEVARIDQALGTASAQQSKARGNDVVGVLLVGVPVSTLSGDNIAPQIANLKGMKNAVEQTMIIKKCPGAV